LETSLGNDGHGDHCSSLSLRIGSCAAERRENITDPKGAKVAMLTDGTRVNAQNAINIAMEDLVDEDQKAIEQGLEEEMAERHHKKLVCF
jgi:hypothetical protein